MTVGSACLVGLIGWPVEHSVSPAMHNAAFEIMGLSWHYTLLPTPPDRVEAVLANLKARGYRGANVTVPHKEAALALAEDAGAARSALGWIGRIASPRSLHVLSVAVNRDDREVVARGEEVQRHADAVVELPLLRIGHVGGVHHPGDEAPGEVAVARHPGLLDAEPVGVLDGALVVVGHPDRERRHVVHEEVGEVLGRDHDQLREAHAALLAGHAKLEAAIDVLKGKLVKRNVSLKSISGGEPKQIGGGRYQATFTLIFSLL